MKIKPISPIATGLGCSNQAPFNRRNQEQLKKRLLIIKKALVISKTKTEPYKQEKRLNLLV